MGFIARPSGSRTHLGFTDWLTIGLKLALDSFTVIKTHPTLVAFPFLGAGSAPVFVPRGVLPIAFPVAWPGHDDFLAIFAVAIVDSPTTFAGPFFTAALV